jgi:lysozyme family protein
MATASIWIAFALGWEGTPEQWVSIAANANDRGGYTRYGVTYAGYQGCARSIGRSGTWEDFRALDVAGAKAVANCYWNAVRGSQIKNQAVANTVADWYWGSGGEGVRRTQLVLRQMGFDPGPIDGQVGPKTLAALNRAPAAELTKRLTQARADHMRQIVGADQSQSVFKNGWLNRVNDLYEKSKPYLRTSATVTLGLIGVGLLAFGVWRASKSQARPQTRPQARPA